MVLRKRALWRAATPGPAAPASALNLETLKTSNLHRCAWVVLRKRALVARRDPLGLLHLLLPVAAVALVLLLLSSAPTPAGPRLELSLQVALQPRRGLGTGEGEGEDEGVGGGGGSWLAGGGGAWSYRCRLFQRRGFFLGLSGV